VVKVVELINGKMGTPYPLFFYKLNLRSRKGKSQHAIQSAGKI